MLDKINISYWKNKKDILQELNEIGIITSERELRKAIKKYNLNFINGKSKYYIAHDNKLGYIKTTDKDLIRLSVEDNKKRAVNQFSLYYHTMKAIGLSNLERLSVDE